MSRLCQIPSQTALKKFSSLSVSPKSCVTFNFVPQIFRENFQFFCCGSLINQRIRFSESYDFIHQISKVMATMQTSEEKPTLSILQGEENSMEPIFIHRLFEESLLRLRSYENTALVFRDDDVAKRQTKYLELNQRSNQIAHLILEATMKSHSQVNQDGDWIIGVCMKPSDSLVMILLAILKAGAAYLPIDVESPQNRLEHIVNEAKPVMVICDDSSIKNFKFLLTVKSIKFDDLKGESSRMTKTNILDEMMLTQGSPDTKAVVIYTSGSTGWPKGVRMSHHTIFHRLAWQLNNRPFGISEKFSVFKTPLTFADHICELWCPLLSGKAVVVVPKNVVKNPEIFVPLLEEYNIERLLSVPTLIRGILLYLNMQESNKTKYMLSRLKRWGSSGEALTVQLAREFFEYFPHDRNILTNFYGCSEINCDVTYFEIKFKEQAELIDRVPLGIPFPNTIVYILDGEMKIVDEGEIGEICCAGVMVSDGYISGRESDSFIPNPHETKEPYNRMYRTGDFGMIKDGLLFFEGRRDNQIKVRGQRVDMSEIEKNINELRYVTKSAILVYNAGETDQALLAFISTNEDKNTPEVEADLEPRLPSYMMPHIYIITEVPFMSNGKVDRQALLKTYNEISGSNKKQEIELDLRNVRKDKIKLAQQVFEIVGTSLGNDLRDKISNHSNFFDLGGNSMNSIYTITQLRNAGLYIGITEFLRAKDLNEVLNKITKVKKPRSDNMKITNAMDLMREPIDSLEKNDCLRLLATCFLNKGDMDKYLDLKVEDYLQVLDGMWDAAIDEGLSFMAKNEKGDLLGVALNFDLTDELEAPRSNPLGTIFEFLESIEKPLIEDMKPSNGEIIHSLMMGTSQDLSPRDNIGVMAFMEGEIIKVAQERGYTGFFTTNSNPLTMQFGQSVFGYETLKEVFIKKYEDKNGNYPFGLAPQTQKVIVMYKSLK